MTEENSVQVYESQAVAPTQPVDSVLAVIARAASDPACDVAKLEALLALKERIDAAEAKRQFHAAMARLQPRMPRVKKLDKITVDSQRTGKTHVTPYATLERIDEAVRDLLADEGFSVSYDTEQADKGVTVRILVSHAAGHTETRSMTLPLDISGSKNATQAVGSTIKYGQRYLLCAFFNIITMGEDNDGAGGTGGAISGDQIKVIEDLLVATKSNRPKFCEHFHIDDVPELPASQYGRAVEMLKAKKR